MVQIVKNLPVTQETWVPPLGWEDPLEKGMATRSSGGFPGGSVVKNPPANAGDIRDLGLIPGSGRSPGGRNGNPLQ